MLSVVRGTNQVPGTSIPLFIAPRKPLTRMFQAVALTECLMNWIGELERSQLHMKSRIRGGVDCGVDMFLCCNICKVQNIEAT